jgi:hypothetical protein
MKPLHGQFEQESNAIAIKGLNLGMEMNHLDPKILDHWLEKRSGVNKRYLNVAQKICEWIVDGNWSDLQQLVNTTWNKN